MERLSASSESSVDSQDMKDILAEIEKLDLDEHQALEVYMTLEKEKRTWKENKRLKMARRKDRRHFSGGRERDREKGRGRGGVSTDLMKKVSRCGNCGEKGHWAEDCTRPYRSKSERLAQEAAQKGRKETPKKVAFVFLGEEGDQAGNTTFVGIVEGGFCAMAVPEYVMKVLQQQKEKMNAESDLQKSFLSIPAGHAIVDPGAGQDLIGEAAYQRLTHQLQQGGLRPVRIEEKPASACGVGGKATTLYQALVQEWSRSRW